MKSSSSGPTCSQSDVPASAVSRQGLSARLLWICGAIGVLAVATILFLFGISAWAAIAVVLLLACPAVVAWVLVGETQAAATNCAEQDMNATSLAARKVDDQSRSNATVEARVTPLGLTGVTQRLETMQIAGTVTYGNYITKRTNEFYRTLASITRGVDRKPATLEISHEHRAR